MRTTAILALVSLSVAALAATPATGATVISPGCQQINNTAAYDSTYFDLLTSPFSPLDLQTYPMFEGETVVITAANPNPTSMTILYLEIYEGVFTRFATDTSSPGILRYTLTRNFGDPGWVMVWGVADPAPGHPPGTAQFTVECIPAGSTASPQPQMQQIGRHADESCDEVDHSVLEWASGIAGGWSRSWAQWPNEGRGGFVCTRMIGYRVGEWSVLS